MRTLYKSGQTPPRSSNSRPYAQQPVETNNSSALSRALGNRRLAGLPANNAGDYYERQADNIATGVTQGRKSNTQTASRQRGAETLWANTASTALRATLGHGRSLTESEQRFFKSHIGHDFAGVHIHTGPAADAAAKSVNARAFTLGNNIVFGNGEYQPETNSGKQLMAHELAHVVQQSQGVRQIQRQARPGTAGAGRRGSVYHFYGCDDRQMARLDHTIRQSYLMIRRAQTALLDYILAGIMVSGSSEYETSLDYDLLRQLLRREFGATTNDQVREIKHRYLLMEYKMRRGLDIECHNDPDRNQVAEAEMPGRRIWVGPRFFTEFNDDLDRRPRVFIHELAHTIGIDHDMPAIRFNADGTVTEGATFAHHADAYATLAYRLYTGRLWQPIDMNEDI